MKKILTIVCMLLCLISINVKAEHWEYKAVGKTTESGDNIFTDLGVTSDGKYVQYYNSEDKSYKYFKYDNDNNLVLENESRATGYFYLINDKIYLKDGCYGYRKRKNYNEEYISWE